MQVHEIRSKAVFNIDMFKTFKYININNKTHEEYESSYKLVD